MKFLIVIFALSMTLFVAACNNGSGGSSNSNNAATPQACNSPFANSSDCQMYQQYYQQNPMQGPWPYGQWTFPNQYQPQVGNCGCASGFPVQGPFGFACAPMAYQNYYQNYFTMVYFNFGNRGGMPYWRYGQNGGPMTMPQAQYNPSTGSCGQSTAQGCDVRMNNCPSGSRCQPIGGGSTVGLCVR